jgi:hypothetical protein
MRRMKLVVIAAVAMCLSAMAGVAHAETIEVTTTADPVLSSCPGAECSLRQAVAVAQSGDVIQLAGTTGSPKTYKLTQGSQIVIAKSMTIQGNGVGATTVDGSANAAAGKATNRILKVTAGTVDLKGLRFANGDDGEDENFGSCNPCFTLNANGGGALFNSGATVSVENVDFDSNGVGSGQPLGGAISNTGTLELKNVLFESDNAAFGGGLFARSGSVTAEDVSFKEDGLSSYGGGAIFVGGGTVSLTNTTVVDSGWASSFGGGIDNKAGTLSLLNDTLSGNLRGALETDTGGNTTVQNTIIGSGFSDNADYDCVAAGKENGANAKTAKAITTDLGNNIDQDGVCELSASGDKTSVDPKLAPIAANGGPVPTQALLHGSAALDAGNDTACPAKDARGTARPQGTHCDIGAFEAVLFGAPSATTEPFQGLTASAATLEATINLAGEAGGFHFLWGTSIGALTEETPETAAGAISSDTSESEELSGLSANTTYFYKAVADNASASTQAGNVRSFTTSAAGPVISEASATAITETTAKIDITINPGGADTEYRVEYGPDSSYGQHTEFADIGAASSPQEVEVPLTGLQAGSSYHFDVVARNSVEPGGVSSGDQQFSTEPEGGSPGTPAISGVSVASVTETTAKIDLTINPDGSDTKYRIEYGSEGSFEESTAFVDIGSGHTPKHLETTLTELEPETTYRFAVEAENEQSDGGEYSAEMEFTTASEAPQPGPPLVSEAKVASTTLTSATLEFAIDPDGADTTYVVKYGAGSPSTQETAPVDIGAAHGVQHITRTLTGLEPGRTYSFEVIASNSQSKATSVTGGLTPELGPVGGSTLGSSTGSQLLVAQTSQPAPPATLATLPPPVLGKSFNVEAVSAKVLIALPAGAAASSAASGRRASASLSKGLHFIPLTEARQIPVGSTLETTAGVARIETATVGKPQLGDFGAGIFKLLQQRGQRGLTELNIVNNASPKKVCATLGKGAAVAAKLSSKVLGRIHGSAHGRFVTKGQYSAATVRGTIWSVQNQCNGTLTKVTRDVVTVRDFRRRKTITLLSGQSYLAKAPG